MEAEERERVEQIRLCIDALIRTMRLHHRIVEKRIDGLGVHHSQHRLLMKLSKLGRSASQKDIAQAMDVSPACVARALKQLSGEGLVEKSEGADGRRNEIDLTGKGRSLVDDSLTVFRQIGEEMFSGISPGELEQLRQLLGRVHENLSEMER